MVFTQGPAAHLRPLATLAGIGTISRNSKSSASFVAVTKKPPVARPQFFVFAPFCMNVPPVPECREMVSAARAFVDGDIHFSALVEPIRACEVWARIHNADHAILSLATDWSLLVDRTWNEFRQHDEPLTVDQLRWQIASDLGDH